MSNEDYESLIRIYFEKSENVVKDRNNFITIFFSILFPVFIALFIDEIFPFIYSGNITGNSNISTYAFVGQIIHHRDFSNMNVLTVMLVMDSLMVFFVLSYLIFELKYKEYRKKYQTLQIEKIVEYVYNTFHPTTYKELCDMVEKRTLFSPEHIMPILKEVYPPPKE